VATATGSGIDPNDLLSPTVRAVLSAPDLGFLQKVLAGALDSVYVLFVGVSILATAVATRLPGGPPAQTSEAGALTSAAPVVGVVVDASSDARS
jgi:hypothetical protein